MSLVVTERGKKELITNALALEELELRLFVDDRFPQLKSSTKSFKELEGKGYKSIQVPSSEWISAGDSTLVTDTYTFEFTGKVEAIFGYLVVGVDSNVLFWAERFPDAPVEILGSRDKIEISLRLTLQ